MKVAELKEQLRSASGRTFSLVTADLNVAGVRDLINARLGGTLAVSNAKPNLDELTVQGMGTVDSMQNTPVKVWFSTDDAADNVTGLLIAFQASDWSINTSFLKFTGDYLQQYSFTSLALVLSARPEDDTVNSYGAGVGVYVNVDSKALFLHACLPPKEQSNQVADITIRGDFTGISLGDLSKLTGFIGGYTFTGLLHDSIPLGDLELRSATFVVNPKLEFIVALSLEVRSTHPWVLLKDKFEFDYLDVSFTINAPGTGIIVYWNITSELKIGNSLKVIAGIDSSLDLLVELAEPVPIKPILNQYFPAGNLDYTVNALRIQLAFGHRPVNWFLYLEVDGEWTLFDSVAIELIRFSINGQGASPEDLKVNAQLKLGDADFYLGGEMNRGAGWDFAGSLAHDYDVQLQPNPRFDPATSGAPIVPVSIDNNVTHFLSTVLDAIFPGSASDVPAMLDLDVKTLAVAFNTQTKDFHFNAEIDFGKKVSTVLTFSSLHQEGAAPTTFEKRATGIITVFPGADNEFAFALGLDLKAGSKHFVAAYSNTSGKPIQFGQLIQAMYPGYTITPPDFSITLQDGIIGYVSDGKAAQSVFALDMGASIDLSGLGNIPLIGGSLSDAKSLSLAFQIVYPAISANTKFLKADLAALNDLIAVAGPRFPADDDLTELFVKTELRLGDGDPIDFKLPVSVNTTSGQLEPDTNKPAFDPSGSQSTDDDVKWIQLNKTFGPLHLQRTGFKFDSTGGTVTALLDGGVTAFGLEVDLVGLSVTTKITGLSDFSPQFGLQGLGISFSKGSVDIAGAFLHLNDEYDGLAVVQAGRMRLAAIGSLKKTKEGETSLFIYAVLDYPLGGVPAFYVTGLSGGFGLNHQLLMPPIDQVSAFPLIKEALNPPQIPTDAGNAGPVITKELAQLEQYLKSSAGQYFACAGIRFTSFELIDSFVVVAVSFGHKFELDLLGLSSLVIPPKQGSGPALAMVSLQLKASFIPEDGIVLVQGQLTRDSYILDPNCHLTGGFGFAVWFGTNPYAGDFVATLGGYHPDFNKPSYYPDAPRLGISWKISTELNVTGSLYFALTPRALMAGGALNATFALNIDLGIASAEVKAWFLLGADFIVYWKPFHYEAHVYVSMGIDVVLHFLGTLHLSLDAGADLEVWGPEFSGRARVYLKIVGINIGFNIAFGDTSTAPPPLDWDPPGDESRSFRKSFLPADNQITAAAVAGGFLRKIDLSNEPGQRDSAAATGADPVWYLVNPVELSIRTNSTIPVKTCETDVPWADGKTSLSSFGANTTFGIAPMGKGDAQVETFHQIRVTRDGVSAEADFQMRPIQKHLPGGLWAETTADFVKTPADVNASALIENAVTGFEIVCGKPPIPGETGAIDREKLAYTTYPMANAWSGSAVAPFHATIDDPGNDPNGNLAILNRIQGEIHVNSVRNSILEDLGFDLDLLDIGENFSVDAAYAPMYGVLAS
jgi:hypothetical protein